LSPVIVVLGFEAALVASALEGLELDPVINERHAQGMHTSVATGIQAVPADCEAAVVLLPDMPLVSAAMLTELIRRFRAARPPLVISVYGETQAPPTLYARALFPELARAGPESGRRVVARHRSDAAEIRWPAAWLADLDRPEDVERVLRLLPRG
jgi:molybdenum cofactor cytidylyltransferase